ncbi:MAG: DUF559 domain-containing protein [Desulfobaccales bacterium]
MRGGSVPSRAPGPLRKRLTDAERLLWRHLRNREIDGWKFRRQHHVGSLYCRFYLRREKPCH